eukprot:SAG31_NODE_2811_length_5052_cov_3.554613_2_plen_57_part_00
MVHRRSSRLRASDLASLIIASSDLSEFVRNVANFWFMHGVLALARPFVRTTLTACE